MTRRVLTALGLACLGLAAGSYLTASAPTVLVVAVIAAPVVIAMRSRALAVALIVAFTPLIDAALAAALGAKLSVHDPYGFSLVEPMFIGGIAGLLLGQIRRRSAQDEYLPALGFYVVAVAGALVLALAPYVVEWRRNSPALLSMMWRSIAYTDQGAVEHTLRASLLLVAGALWFSLVRASVRKHDDVRRIALAWLVTSLVVAIYGTRMWIRGEGYVAPRVEALFDDVNSYGSYLVLTFFLAWAVVMTERIPWRRALAAVALVAALWMLLLSGSRIAIIAALTGAATIAALRTDRRKLLLAALSLALVGGVFLTSNAVVRRHEAGLPRLVREVAAPKFLIGYLQENRLAVWSATTRAFLDHPVLGLGPGLLYRDLGRYYRPDDRGWRPPHENAHNYFLQMAAETGLVGLLAFGWLVWAGLRPGLAEWRNRQSVGPVLAIGGLAYLATAVTGHPLILSRQVVLFWAYVALVPAWSNVRETRGVRSVPVARIAMGSVVVLVVLLVGYELRSAGCGGLGDPAAPLTSDFAVGFHPAEDVEGTEWRWMRDAGQLVICNRHADVLIADVVLPAQSFYESRRLEVHVGGSTVADVEIAAAPSVLTISGIPLRHGKTSLILVPRPGARRVNRLLHNGDQRLVSIRFANPSVSVRAR